MKFGEFWTLVNEVWFHLNWDEYEKMEEADQVAFDFIATHLRERTL